MKKVIIAVGAIFIMACTGKYDNVQNTAEDYQVIPKPAELTMQVGKFVIDGGTSISAAEGLKEEATFLAESIQQLTQVSPSITDQKANIALALNDQIENEEGYTLDVTPDQINISGKNAKGVFYGIQSLVQLISLPEEGSSITDVTVPAVSIKDQPRFIYRGMHLDVARHFFDVDFVKKYIDMIAMHKMNTFHWHLTEDQGWRIEIKKYPELTKVGAYRNGTITGHYPGETNDNERYGGFYTQDDIKEVLAYAQKRHVEVIPEIELPGHSQAAIASYPYLSCFPEEPTEVPNGLMSEASKEQQKNGQPKVVQESWGVYNDVYCAGKEETFAFLEGVLDEVTALFPSKYIHIGGDECPKKNWERCPNCQKRIKEEGLEDEHALQSYFVTRMEKYLNSKGKQIIGWDEILEGGLAPNATVMSWRGVKGGIEAAKQDHNVIMTPNSHCYFDHYQSKDTDNEPLSIGGFLPVEKVYSYEPVPEELSADQQHYILGAQGNIWSEYIPTDEHMEYMALPRATALSEVVWSQKEDKDFEDFKSRLNHMRKLYETKGYNYAKHVFDTAENTPSE
ncbi:beta-N-acetylhexosaminidase [Flagellimonas olearia]|uniref:beta-N-acetylhexosaminidase n=1 Tax=Flagellimonas olearia TaxID=552546 RepID=A0A444VIT2_9FLAO|nr:beta-N-acetylhexosaminidase [Allomuricauda olearia]RYC50678.1 beta-N-acetylglucosaminidase [Allomuricauda olearia]